MDSKVYTRALMIMIIVLFSGFGFAADRLVPGTYATIQLAIDASDPGDNIIVSAGTYTENLTIDEEVTITGASNTTTFIVGHHTVTADNVSVTLFDLTNSTSYVFILDASGGALSDFSVTYCVFNLVGWGGVHIGGDAGSANAISNVTIDHNSFDGPASMASNPFKIGGFFGAGSGQQVTNVDFTNNTVTEGSIPINLKDENIDDILIDNNTFTTTDGLVYVWSDNDPTGVLSNFVFTNNNADATNNYGVGLGLINVAGTYDDANFGTGNTVNNNSFVGIDGAYGFLTVSLLGTYTTYTLPANCNWWGELGFNADDQVNSNVTQTTYLENGTDSNPGDPGFDPSATCGSVTCSDPESTDYNFAATPAEDSWTTHTATLTADACVVYKVTCTVGKQYTFKTGCDDGATAAFDTFMDLYDASGNWISQNDDGCTDYRSTITWTATETVAYIKIRGYNSTQYGAVTVAYEYTTPVAGATCKTPTDFDAAVTPALDSWTTDGSNTLAADACYIYKVTCTVGQQYTFKTGCDDGATADFDTFIELYDSEGTWVAQNDDGCTEYRSTITWIATETIAYVKVRGYNYSSVGDFTVAYEYTAPAAGGTCKTPTDFDAAVTPAEDSWTTDGSNTLAADACYVYKVTCTVGKSYTFKTGCDDGATADFDTFIELYDSEGTWVAQNDDGCTEYRSTITWTATETIAYVKIRGYNSSAYGDFTVAYEYTAAAAGGTCETPPASDETLTPAPTASWQTDGSTAIASDACYVYEVAVTTNNTYYFKTGCTDGTANFDTFIELYDGDGEWLTQDDDGCAVPASLDYSSKLEWAADYTGLAYVKVRGYNSGDYGNFTLAYKYVVGGTCKTPTDYDETLTAPTTGYQTDAETIASDACYVYKVAVTTGNTYTFKTGCTEGSTDFDTFIELYDGDGEWLTQDDDECSVPASGDYSSKVEWPITYTGYAYVKVRGYNSGAFGDYTLAYKYVATGPDVITLGYGENLAKNLVKVYPNPADQVFTIVSQAPVYFTRILISEFTGRVAKSWTLDQPATSFRIESTNLAPGVYILSIETSDGWIRKKVSIIR